MVTRLSPKDIEDLKKQGYSEGEIQMALKELEKEELDGSYSDIQHRRNIDPRQNSQLSSFSAKAEDNIVRWQ
jgi:hypothetical protein